MFCTLESWWRIGATTIQFSDASKQNNQVQKPQREPEKKKETDEQKKKRKVRRAEIYADTNIIVISTINRQCHQKN